MSTLDDRIIITPGAHSTEVLIRLGDTTLNVNMPSPTGSEDMSEEQVRRVVLSQLKRVLGVARDALD